MILIVKGPKWQARLEAEKRGIVWKEEDPDNPYSIDNKTYNESVVLCAEKYRDHAIAWFCESSGASWSLPGTLLFYSGEVEHRPVAASICGKDDEL